MLAGRRKGGDWSEASWQEKRRRLFRGKLAGEKEETVQRLAGRRKGGDWSEAAW